MSFKTPKSFPEMPRSSHSADEAGKASYTKSSQKQGDGHLEDTNRMPQPFNADWCNEESGEGQDNSGHVYGKRQGWYND